MDGTGFEADADIVATLDLDGDGAAELWLRNEYYEGASWMLVRWRGDRWQIVDSFGYGL